MVKRISALNRPETYVPQHSNMPSSETNKTVPVKTQASVRSQPGQTRGATRVTANAGGQKAPKTSTHSAPLFRNLPQKAKTGGPVASGSQPSAQGPREGELPAPRTQVEPVNGEATAARGVRRLRPEDSPSPEKTNPDRLGTRPPARKSRREEQAQTVTPTKNRFEPLSEADGPQQGNRESKEDASPPHRSEERPSPMEQEHAAPLPAPPSDADTVQLEAPGAPAPEANRDPAPGTHNLTLPTGLQAHRYLHPWPERGPVATSSTIPPEVRYGEHG